MIIPKECRQRFSTGKVDLRKEINSNNKLARDMYMYQYYIDERTEITSELIRKTLKNQIRTVVTKWSDDDLQWTCTYIIIPDIATCRLTEYSDGYIVISDLYVVESFRSIGIGDMILDKCDELHGKVDDINIWAKDNSLYNYYKKRGYIVHSYDEDESKWNKFYNFLRKMISNMGYPRFA